MPKLCQVNALVTGRKSEAEKAVGDIYKVLQKPELFGGLAKTYRAYAEENAERLPDEHKKVQFTAKSLIDMAKAKWTELWDLTFTQDAGNTQATGDIIVDEQTVMAKVPVTSLLFIEKQVNDVESFVSKLPTPDSSEDWTYDPNLGLLKTGARETVRSRKEPGHYEKSPATKEHPAQVEFFYRDVPVGVWQTTQFTGAIAADDRAAILARVKKLKDAIKVAREQANSVNVETRKAGDPLFGFIFG